MGEGAVAGNVLLCRSVQTLSAAVLSIHETSSVASLQWATGYSKFMLQTVPLGCLNMVAG
jgi:hypothetical protein